MYKLTKFFIELTLMWFFVRNFSLIRHIKLIYNLIFFSTYQANTDIPNSQHLVVSPDHWTGTLNSSSSPNFQMWSVNPLAIIGVLCSHFLFPSILSNLSDICGLTKLYHACKKSIILVCLVLFLLKFIVFLMNLAREFRIVRLKRSHTCSVKEIILNPQ